MKAQLLGDFGMKDMKDVSLISGCKYLNIEKQEIRDWSEVLYELILSRVPYVKGREPNVCQVCSRLDIA